jgi:hypothetical protein
MTLKMSRPIVYVTAAAALVALLVIARPALYSTADPVEQASNQVTPAGPLPVVPVVDLNLDRLRATAGSLKESERDPFRFRPKPPPPAPRVQAPPVVFAPPPVPTGPPPPPPIPLKFLGFVTIAGQRVAAFSDARGNTFNGKEGDVLEGRYRLLRIGTDSVDVAYSDGRGRQAIRMTGQ